TLRPAPSNSPPVGRHLASTRSTPFWARPAIVLSNRSSNPPSTREISNFSSPTFLPPCESTMTPESTTEPSSATMRRPMRPTIARMILCAAALLPAPAHPNGAFPDSLSIMLPPDHPHEIVLATNFGLLISEDDGATWHWVCEQAVASLSTLYQMGPP